jgi:hypothetical protein
MTPKEITMHWLKDESCQNCSVAHDLRGSIIFKLLSDTEDIIKSQNCECAVEQHEHGETSLIMPIARVCDNYKKISK